MKKGEINVDLIEHMGDDLTVVRAARMLTHLTTQVVYTQEINVIYNRRT